MTKIHNIIYTCMNTKSMSCCHCLISTDVTYCHNLSTSLYVIYWLTQYLWSQVNNTMNKQWSGCKNFQSWRMQCTKGFYMCSWVDSLKWLKFIHIHNVNNDFKTWQFLAELSDYSVNQRCIIIFTPSLVFVMWTWNKKENIQLCELTLCNQCYIQNIHA